MAGDQGAVLSGSVRLLACMVPRRAFNLCGEAKEDKPFQRSGGLMNWKYIAALIVLYLCGVITGMDVAFRIDAHMVVIQAIQPGVEK